MAVYDLVMENARVYALDQGHLGTPASSLAVRAGRIAALDVPASAPARARHDAAQAVILPGFVDCHTHLCYAGNRMEEHAAYLGGTSYEAIARRGGGIRATVAAVAAAGEQELVDQSLPRLAALAREGATTVEIKSGYGLTPTAELKQLRAIRRLGETAPVRIVATYLALHAIPPGVKRTNYLHQVIDETLPAVAAEGLAECVDVFCESIAFTVEEMRAVFGRARELGLACRAHTEQLTHQGATRAAAELGAISCDHLEYADEDDIAAMAAHNTVAVLLPGAFYFLGERRVPPVSALRAAGVPMALATDLNPGSSPIASPLAALHLGANLFRLTPAEALAGFTWHGASALGRRGEIGTLRPGARADFTLWDIPGPEFLSYRLGGLAPRAIYLDGRKQDA